MQANRMISSYILQHLIDFALYQNLQTEQEQIRLELMRTPVGLNFLMLFISPIDNP